MAEALLTTKRHNVLVHEPHDKSRASLVMLTHFYRTFEVEKWLKFRLEFLEEQLNLFGDLVCHYCGKKNLLVEDQSRRRRRLATLDHVNPRANGGAEYDKDNLVVACAPCNEKKADKLL